MRRVWKFFKWPWIQKGNVTYNLIKNIQGHITIPWATFLVGIISVGIGVVMIYQKTSITIGPVSFSAGLVLLILGFVLIVLALRRFPKMEGAQNPAKIWLGRNWLVLLGIILLGTFIGTHYKFPTEDKYKILLDLILIMVGLTAAVGYGIFKWISRNIEGRVATIADEIRKVASDDRNIIKAEVQTSLGFVWFQHHELGIKHEGTAKTDNKPTDYIALAIIFAESALKHANELDEIEHEELISRCRSNLAYYLAERHRTEKHPEDKERALELARHTYLVAKEERAIEYVRPYNWEETYAWVLWQFADDDEAAKEKARQIIDGLKKHIDIPDPWQKKIREKWDPLLTTKNT